MAVTSVVRFLPGLLFGAYGGVVAERFERTRVLIVASLACCLVLTAMTITVVADGPVVLLVALSVVSSTLGTPINPAVGALVPQMVPEDNLAAANAIQATIENVATIVGPGLGALLLLTGDPSIAFGFDAATFVVAAAVFTRIRARSTPTDVKQRGSSVWAQLVVGLRAMRDLPTARLPVLLCALATVVYGTDSVLFVPISGHLHGGTSGYGYLFAAQAAGSVAAILVINRLAERNALAWSIGVGMAAYCLPTALIPALHTMSGGVAVQLVRGAGGTVVDVLALTALQRSVPSHLLSRVLGVLDSLLFASAAVGALMIPPILRATGLSSTLFIVAFGAFGVAALGLPGLRRLDTASREAVRRLQPTIAVLGGVDILAATDRTGLERLAKATQSVKLPSGSVVVREGDVADAFYVVSSGEVKVTSHGESGEEVKLRQLATGDYFGEIGLLHGIPRTATVTTLTDSELLRISADDFVSSVASEAASPALLATAGTRLARSHPVLADEVAGSRSAT